MPLYMTHIQNVLYHANIVLSVYNISVIGFKQLHLNSPIFNYFFKNKIKPRHNNKTWHDHEKKQKYLLQLQYSVNFV